MHTSRKTSYWLIGTIILIGILWFIPPHINNPVLDFLKYPLNRLLLLLTTCATLWLIYEQLLTRKQQKQQKGTPNPEITQQVRLAIRYLKNISTKKSEKKLFANKRLPKLPWILILGTDASGKTELIYKTGLKFLHSKPPGANNTHRYFELYATREAILFDVTNQFANFENSKNLSQAWQTFFQQCQKYHKPVFNGILINLSIQQLTSLHAQPLNQLLNHHKKSLQCLNQMLKKPIPVFICINHMDSLTGFDGYFTNLDATQRDQPWGIALDNYQFHDINQLCERFDQQFDIITQQLHNQLISKLHQEPQHSTRCLIEEFPLQMEAIKRPLARILQYLSECFIQKNGLHLKGIYFTATGKTEQRIDRLLPAINKTFALSTELTPISHQLNTYFVRGLFTKVIFPYIRQHQQQLNWMTTHPNYRYGLSLSVTSILIITCTIIWSKQLSSNLQSVSTIDQSLNQYLFQTHSNELSLKKSLQGLSALQTAVDTLSYHRTTMLSIPIFKNNELTTLAQIAYETAASRLMHQLLTSTLKKILQSPKENAAAQIYRGLKFYLQIIKNRPININDVEYWLTINNPNFRLNAKTLQAFHQHMKLFTTYNPPRIKVDLPLIQQSRQQLIDLPRSELALTMILEELADHIPKREIPLTHINHMIPILTAQSNIIIPGIYTREAFAETYETLIPQAAEMALQGNWVTGKIYQQSQISPQESMQEIASLYFQNYAQTWKEVLDNLQLTPFHSYQHAIQVIDNFTKQNSALYELLQIANYHTDVRYNDVSTPISIKFQELHKMFDGYSENNYFAVKAQIRKMQEILVTIANTPNHEKASFIVAKQRMLSEQEDIFDELQHRAITLPAPLRQWILSLNQFTWQLILNDARSYINHAWDKNIVSYFNQHMKGHYPFDSKARREIRLAEFNQFFSQLGLIDKFYLDYLAAFIENNQSELHWKSRNSATLGHNSIYLANLQQLLSVRDNFFSENPTQAKLEFSIQPIALQPIVKTSLFSVDEQQARFSHYAQVPQTFSWPSQQALHLSSLAIIGVDGKQVKASETGLWSLFRLLQHGTIKPTQEDNSILVTFDIQGYGAEFELMTKTEKSPFNPTLFTSIAMDEIR